MMTTTWNKMCSFRSQSSSSTAGKSSASSFRRRGGRRGNERGGGREQRTKTRAASSQHPPEEKDNNDRILERLSLFSSDFLCWVRSEEKFFFREAFSSFPAKRLNFFFPRLKNTAITYSLRFEKEPLLLCDDDALKEQQQQHATTTAKESTSEKSGEREDGFEGTRERRTFGVCAFEDS